MKWLLFTLGALFTLNAHALPECNARFNGTLLKLEKSSSGLQWLSDTDPNFELVDVMINEHSPDTLHVRIARFVPKKAMGRIIDSLGKLPPDIAGEILQLAQTRVVDGSFAFDSKGAAQIRLSQDDDNLNVECFRTGTK